MIRLRRPEIIMVSACLFLTGMLTYQTLVPIPHMEAEPIRVPLGPAPPPPLHFVPPAEAAFDIIEQHPILSPERKPFATPANSLSGASAAPPDLIFTGVIIDQTSRLAQVKREGNPLSISVIPGTSIDGWQVTEITADHLTLESNGKHFVLPLYTKQPRPQRETVVPTLHGQQPSTVPTLSPPVSIHAPQDDRATEGEPK